MLNVYLDQADHLGTKNRAIMMMAGVTIEYLAIPYIMGGDWNLTPNELADTEWLDTIDGHIAAPTEPTCKRNRKSSGRTAVLTR